MAREEISSDLDSAKGAGPGCYLAKIVTVANAWGVDCMGERMCV